MSFLGKIFGKKSTAEPHNFSQLISGRDRLIVFLPDDVFDSYHILTHVAVWKDIFKEIIVFVPRYYHSFFSKFEISNNLKYDTYTSEQIPLIGSTILNFSREKGIEKYLRTCKNSTIVDTTNNANLQFIPSPRSAEEIVEKFAGFADLPFDKIHLSFELTQSEHFNNKQKYFHNRFPDYVLDISSNIPTRQLDKLISNLKLSFSANVYLTQKSIKNPNYPNLECIELETFLQLFQYAVSCNMFLTTDYSCAGVLQELKQNCIHLGEGFDSTHVRSVKILDFNRLQELVPALVKKLL